MRGSGAYGFRDLGVAWITEADCRSTDIDKIQI